MADGTDQTYRQLNGLPQGSITLGDLGAYEPLKDSNGQPVTRNGQPVLTARAGNTTPITGSRPNASGGRTSTFVGANIVINNNANGPFVSTFQDYLGVGANDRTYRAITILHELGHLIFTVYGKDSSTILPDDNGQINKDNSRRVYDACFGPV